MKKAFIVLALVGFVVGCMPSRSALDRLRTRNRQNLSRLAVGMAKDEALAVMGLGRGGGKGGEPTVTNPYKKEILQGPEKTFEVYSYYTDVKSVLFSANEVIIDDDELTPLVFEDGRLIGWGNSFLKSNMNRFSIPAKQE